MKNRGFTLIEILAVIAIMAIILVIAATSIFNSSDKMKEKSLKSKIDLIEKSTLIYVQSNANSLRNEYSDSRKCRTTNDCFYEFYMSIDTLIELGIYKSEKDKDDDENACDVVNPVDGSCLDAGEVMVLLDDNYKTAEVEFIIPTDNSVLINSGDKYTNQTAVTLSLYSKDATQMCISNSNSSCTSYINYKTSYDWTIPSGDGQKYVYVWFKDAYGNTTKTPAYDSIILDTTPPSNGSVSINSNASHTNNVNVKLTISSSGTSKMCISNSNEICTSYVSYKTSYDWTLLSGDGEKIVYVWFKDGYGNTSVVPASDSIILDTVPPSNGTVSINSNATYTSNTKVSLNISNPEAAQMCVSNSNSSCASYVSYKNSYDWTLASTNGTQNVYVWFKDSAGNVTSSATSDSIVLDTSAPIINAKANSVSFPYKSSNTVSSLYTVTYGPSGGSTTCKVGSTTVTNTSSLATGNHSLVCTAKSNAGKSSSKTISIIIEPAEVTINFNDTSDINYFTITSNSKASVYIKDGYLYEFSSVIDNSRKVILKPSNVNMSDISYVEFKMKKTATRSGVFPHLRVTFEDGKKFYYILMNFFTWYGYESWYGQALYSLGYSSMWAFGNSGSLCYQPSECTDQTTGVYGSVCSAFSHTTEAVYSVTFNKSTGKITLYNGYCGKTVTTSALTTSKIKEIDFNFQDDWFNNEHYSMIDYIKLKQ